MWLIVDIQIDDLSSIMHPTARQYEYHWITQPTKINYVLISAKNLAKIRFYHVKDSFYHVDAKKKN